MNQNRPDKDTFYLRIAREVSTRSTCLRTHYGAVLVRDDTMISSGYNGAPRGDENCIDKGDCLRTKLGLTRGQNYELCCAIHAEDNAITNAGREAIGSTLYIAGVDAQTGELHKAEPCIMCARKIRNMRIARVVGLTPEGPVDYTDKVYSTTQKIEEP